jgi:hypothetical protein
MRYIAALCHPRFVPDFLDFLEWIRRETESAWARVAASSIPLSFGATQWRAGSRWTGLDEQSIRAAEAAFGSPFPSDYRLFLSVLHTVDRPRIQARFEGEQRILVDAPSFTDWRDPAARIREAEEWLVDGLAFDVEQNGLWLESWGTKPATPEARAQKVRELVQRAPRLIPLIGHRFLVPSPVAAGNPVLSIYQSDAIVYAPNLKSLLLDELADLLPSGHDEPAAFAEQELRLSFWDELVG